MWFARSSFFRTSAFLLLVPAMASAQDITPVEAVEALEELLHRQGCRDVGDCEVASTPTDEEIREDIHALHPIAPSYEEIPGPGVESEHRALADAVCAVVDDEWVERDGKWVYLPAGRHEYPALLGHEEEWSLNEAATGLLIRFDLAGSMPKVGVLTVGHTTTHDESCAGDEGYLFVFGLDEYTHVERDGDDTIRVPAEDVVQADCNVFYLRTELSDVAFYEVPDAIAERYPPYAGALEQALAEDDVYSIGFPQGLARRLTRGVVDAATESVPQREFRTSLYTQAGMSGAPVFRDGVLVGMHLSSSAVRTDPDDCLACPVPCIARTESSEAGALVEPACTESGSWSTEAGQLQLGSLLDVRVLARDTSVVSKVVTVRAEGGARFLRLDPRTNVYRVAGPTVALGAQDQVLVHMPPGSRLSVLGRRQGESRFRWKSFLADDLRDDRELALMQRPRRLVITDAAPGRHEFRLVPRENE